MKIQKLRDIRLPERATQYSGGYDIYMPEDGTIGGMFGPAKVGLGFATAIPPGFVALLLPRSGCGSKFGVELQNTCGVIDADYRGEWFATLRTKNGEKFSWEKGERVLQMILVPVITPDLEVVDSLDETSRGAGGLGSTGR